MTVENTAPQEADTQEAPAEETPEAVESAPVEATEETQDEAATDGAEATEEAVEAAKTETPEQKHKRAGGWQRKIEKLERDNARIQAERDALVARLLGEEPAATPKTEPKAKTPQEQAAEFIQAEVDRRLAEKEAKAAQYQAQAEFARRVEEVRTVYPDFQEVLEAAEEPVPPIIAEALLTSEHGPAIMYQLAKEPDVLARISALPPLQAVREIGRLEARLASGTATPKTNPKPVATRKPAVPAPITPVTGRGQSTIKSPDQMSYEEYNAWRKSQTKR